MSVILLFAFATTVMIADQDILNVCRPGRFKPLQTINTNIKDSNITVKHGNMNMQGEFGGFLTKNGTLSGNILEADLKQVLQFYGFRSDNGVIENNKLKASFTDVSNFNGFLAQSGTLNGNILEADLKQARKIYGFGSDSGKIADNKLAVSLNKNAGNEQNTELISSQSGKIINNDIALMRFDYIGKLVGISSAGEISQNNLAVDAISMDDTLNLDTASLILAKDADVSENNIEFDRSNVNSATIISALSSNIHKNNIKSRLSLKIKNNLQIISAKSGKIDQNVIEIKDAIIEGTMNIASTSNAITHNQINIEKIESKSHIIGLMTDQDIVDNNITIKELYSYQPQGFLSSSINEAQNLIVGHSKKGDVSGNIITLEKSVISGDLIGIGSDEGVVNKQQLSIINSHISGDLVGADSDEGVVSKQQLSIINSSISGDLLVARAKQVKDSMLNLVSSKIGGDIKGAGSDMSIYAEGNTANNIKEFKTITFYLRHDTKKNAELMVLKTKEKIDLRGVKLLVAVNKFDIPKIKVGSYIVLIKTKGEIIIDDKTVLETLNLEQEKRRGEGYEFRLEVHKDKLLAVATKSEYKPYKSRFRRRFVIWDLFE